MEALNTANADVTSPVPVKILGSPAVVDVKNETPVLRINCSSSLSSEGGIKSTLVAPLKGNDDVPLTNII